MDMLDQGPLHMDVHQHMEKIIETPSLLVLVDATMDGTE
jgi:hypothetical protein